MISVIISIILQTHSYVSLPPVFVPPALFFDCSRHSEDEEACRNQSQCIFHGWEGCVHFDRACVTMQKTDCQRYVDTFNICYWNDEKQQCLEIHKICSKNEFEACIYAKHCEWDWDESRCNSIPGYGKNCSNDLNHLNYTGTLNTTCDDTPCLNWEYAIKWAYALDKIEFKYDGYRSANNYCRQDVKKLNKERKRSWCYVNTNRNLGGKIPWKLCCVPQCGAKTSLSVKMVECSNYNDDEEECMNSKNCGPGALNDRTRRSRRYLVDIYTTQL